ncbi:IclR family transcriptional regulator [Nocardioides carbamazepini]|uniref:IclR family transcriptional regulator n=1 Tax=Nocardioides carbamazepini TaxID=2854259 RepID=UPI00214A38E2|nr:IclR family transcriptional regulator [Nocardioides carbamazepini]MCR1782705.1 IclR family transcriptional regulator [Nocardioides carbamazepini]
MEKPPGSSVRSVQSVDRAVDIMLAFTAAHPQLTLRDLADTVGLPASSTHRIARTLVERGFLRQDDWGSYALGSRLLELGGLVSNAGTLSRVTSDVVHTMAETTGETILVAEANWIDNTVLITRKIDSTHVLSVASPVGKRSGMGGGCIGKAVLAGLPSEEAEILLPRIHLVRRTPSSVVGTDQLAEQVDLARRRGWASESDEYIPGVSGVAVPVTLTARPIGAVAVIVPTARGQAKRLAELGKALTKLVAAASKKAIDDLDTGSARKSP